MREQSRPQPQPHPQSQPYPVSTLDDKWSCCCPCSWSCSSVPLVPCVGSSTWCVSLACLSLVLLHVINSVSAGTIAKLLTTTRTNTNANTNTNTNINEQQRGCEHGAAIASGTTPQAALPEAAQLRPVGPMGRAWASSTGSDSNSGSSSGSVSDSDSEPNPGRVLVRAAPGLWLPPPIQLSTQPPNGGRTGGGLELGLGPGPGLGFGISVPPDMNMDTSPELDILDQPMAHALKLGDARHMTAIPWPGQLPDGCVHVTQDSVCLNQGEGDAEAEAEEAAAAAREGSAQLSGGPSGSFSLSLSTQTSLVALLGLAASVGTDRLVDMCRTRHDTRLNDFPKLTPQQQQQAETLQHAIQQTQTHARTDTLPRAPA